MKHGHAQTESRSRVYNTWRGIRQRCNNPKASYYSIYGGAGIRVSPEWDKFKDFLDWAMANGYDDTLSIERRDPEKDYSPENCHWACMSEQQSNKRKRINGKSNYIGVSKNRSKWSACVRYKGEMYWLGTFVSELEAAQVRDAFVKANSLPHRLNF